MPESRPRRAPAPMPIRFSRRHRFAIYAAFGALWASGGLWLVFHYFLRVQGPFGPEPHALEPWWLRAHGLAFMASLLAIGSVLAHHVGRAWQLRRNRGMGAALTGTAAWMAGTGYALYYFSSDANAAWLPLLHWVPGLALPLVLLAHVRRGRRRMAPASMRVVGARQAQTAPAAQAAPDRVANAPSAPAQRRLGGTRG